MMDEKNHFSKGKIHPYFPFRSCQTKKMMQARSLNILTLKVHNQTVFHCITV